MMNVGTQQLPEESFTLLHFCHAFIGLIMGEQNDHLAPSSWITIQVRNRFHDAVQHTVISTSQAHITRVQCSTPPTYSSHASAVIFSRHCFNLNTKLTNATNAIGALFNVAKRWSHLDFSNDSQRVVYSPSLGAMTDRAWMR